MTRFLLAGFTQDADVRVFAFHRVEADRTHTTFTVSADLSLVRKYDIHLQELPLLCRKLLHRREDLEPGRALSFTEADMCRHQSAWAAMKQAGTKKSVQARTEIARQSITVGAGAAPVPT